MVKLESSEVIPKNLKITLINGYDNWWSDKHLDDLISGDWISKRPVKSLRMSEFEGCEDRQELVIVDIGRNGLPDNVTTDFGTCHWIMEDSPSTEDWISTLKDQPNIGQHVYLAKQGPERVDVSETYKIPNAANTVKNKVEVWHIDGSIASEFGYIWDRRKNLHGTKVNVGFVRLAGVAEIPENGTSQDVFGTNIDLARVISRQLNFTPVFKESPGGLRRPEKWGVDRTDWDVGRWRD